MGISDKLCLLRSIFRHHLHCAGKNYVRGLGHDVSQHRLGRIGKVMDAPSLAAPQNPRRPEGGRVEFKDVSFTYEGAKEPALSHVSFKAEPGQTVALVGPSGGGKTTAASLIPRFWDASSGAVEIGGVNVSQIDPHVLMDQVAFVFQNSRLFKTSILENVRAARPEAPREQVMEALMAAQCGDILEKLPDDALSQSHRSRGNLSLRRRTTAHCPGPGPF